MALDFFVRATRWLCFLAVAAAATDKANPKADPSSIVVAGHARFTVLTSQLIRMEWSATGTSFRDAATTVIMNRMLPVPDFKVDKMDKWIRITTAELALSYDTSSTVYFSDCNLRVQVKSLSPTNKTSINWTPSMIDKDSKRLFGSLRTLDMINGSVNLDCNADGPDAIADSHCTYGLISRSGYVVVDDSLSTELDNDPWPWVVTKQAKPATSCQSIPKSERRVCGYNVVSKEQCDANGCCFDDATPLPNGFSCFYGPNAYQDLYFFGHGLRYKQALKDFTLVAGNIPLPPKFAFGVFYSRWWAYNDVGIESLAKQYQIRSIPLDVVVLDMDWHLTFYKNNSADQSGQSKGWTGYTWNKELFPNPKAFLSHLHELGLHVTMNLHPASGVQPWEESYEQVARSMGIDPKSGKYVPFDLTNKSYATSWLIYSLKPREEEGVDFWWLDWQQGEDWFLAHNQASPNLNPTLWLNYVFFTNPHHWTKKRPVLLHRFGGLGNHRYPLGFSGDVVPSWESLNFQLFFTSMAANVGFSYWSHDIGGFQRGNDPELYTRWIQWGVFSPVLRTHSTKDNISDRRIWKYPNDNYEIMRTFLDLRRRLVPYIYTQSRLAHENGLSLLHGLYYDWPEHDESYSYSRQYLFGSSYLVAPILSPVDHKSQIAKKTVWLPPGSWYDMTFGSLVQGPALYTHVYTLAEIPLFARAGSIIPMAPSSTSQSLGQAMSEPSPLTLSIVPGSSIGNGSLYEDAGDTQKYLESEYSWGHFSYRSKDNGIETTIHPYKGSYPGQATTRKYILEFRHAVPAKTVTVNGQQLKFIPYNEKDDDGWRYDAEKLTLKVYLLSEYQTSSSIVVHVTFEKGEDINLNGVLGGIARVQKIKEILDLQPVYAEDYPHFRRACGTGRRISYNTSSFFDEIKLWSALLKYSTNEIEHLKIPENIRSHLLALLHDSILQESASMLSHSDHPSSKLKRLDDEQISESLFQW
ncbi:hypothetical protein Ae201684P_020972 [Aphanomyces euteiches]|uniref:P-type domain-containing protein n=1 Tax=Aphanomyces euteiches TaxID=100861 RepID=A0A6G0WWN5_9STRA|nr:hypothetical protein Ae201684_010928 [Aphanomyces euteiches]KAH9061637.1 hypothetical protein Ae201684P_020972 [Aphanomyces euteiches]